MIKYNEKVNENLKFKLTYEWIFAVIATSCKIFCLEPFIHN